MQKIIDFLVGRWNTLDPKLKYTILTGAVAWVVAKYGIKLDATLSAVIAGAIGSASGYRASNEGTVLRTPQEDGNAKLPPHVEGS